MSQSIAAFGKYWLYVNRTASTMSREGFISSFTGQNDLGLFLKANHSSSQ